MRPSRPTQQLTCSQVANKGRKNINRPPSTPLPERMTEPTIAKISSPQPHGKQSRKIVEKGTHAPWKGPISRRSNTTGISACIRHMFVRRRCCAARLRTSSPCFRCLVPTHQPRNASRIPYRGPIDSRPAQNPMRFYTGLDIYPFTLAHHQTNIDLQPRLEPDCDGFVPLPSSTRGLQPASPRMR